MDDTQRGGEPAESVDRDVEKRLSSSELLDEAVDEPVELRISLAESVDLADGVDDSRVVLAAEGFTDIRKARFGEGLTHVHGDLPRQGDGPRIVPSFQVRDFKAVVVGHELLYRVEVDEFVLARQKVAEYLLGERQVDGAPGE